VCILLVAAIPTALFPARAADIVLDEDELKDLNVMPTAKILGQLSKQELKDLTARQQRRLEQEFRALGRASAPQPGATRRIKNVKLIRVIPRRQNNPFNQREPVKNQFVNGRVVLGDDGQGDQQGGDGQGQGACCNCAPATNTQDFFKVIIVRMNPNTTGCSVGDPGGLAQGQIECFDVTNPWSGMLAPPGTVFLQSNPANEFTITQAPPAAVEVTPGISWTVAPGAYQFTIRHDPTGKQWRFSVIIEGIGAGGATNFGDVRLTTINVTPL